MALIGAFDGDLSLKDGLFSEALPVLGWIDDDFFDPPSGQTLVGSFSLAVHTGITFSGILTLLGSMTLAEHNTFTPAGKLTLLGSLTLPEHNTFVVSSAATLIGSFTLSESNTIRFDIPVTTTTLDLLLRIGYEPMTATIQVGGDS